MKRKEAQTLDSVIAEWIRENGLEKPLLEHRVVEQWAEILGPTIARYTRDISVKDGMKCTEEEIVEFCNDLPRYKRPRKIIFADVPRNPTGKIEKPVLRERYRAANLVEQQITS